MLYKNVIFPLFQGLWILVNLFADLWLPFRLQIVPYLDAAIASQEFTNIFDAFMYCLKVKMEI